MYWCTIKSDKYFQIEIIEFFYFLVLTAKVRHKMLLADILVFMGQKNVYLEGEAIFSVTLQLWINQKTGKRNWK